MAHSKFKSNYPILLQGVCFRVSRVAVVEAFLVMSAFILTILPYSTSTTVDDINPALPIIREKP